MLEIVLAGMRRFRIYEFVQEAKQRHLITSVKPILDDLIARARFRVSRKLYQRTLFTAGE